MTEPVPFTIRKAAVDQVRNRLWHRLARRQQEKAEMERQLHAVEDRYQEEVAPIKEKLLRLQVERLRRQAQRHMRSARHRNAYHDAQRTYESFLERLDERSGCGEDVKRRFREASKRCHPDLVPESYSELAAATFQTLESAYQDSQARTVYSIADALSRWGFPRGADVAETEADGRTVEDLRRAVSQLESAIDAIRRRDSYRAVQDAGDVDSALQAHKKALLERLRHMQGRT